MKNLQLIILFTLLLAGCDKSDLPKKIESLIEEKYDSEIAESVRKGTKENISLLELKPLKPQGDLFRLRIIGHGGFGFGLYSTDLVELPDGMGARITYRSVLRRDEGVRVTRTELLHELEFKTLLNFRTSLDEFWNWPIFEDGKEDIIIDDGMGWIIEAVQGDQHHIIFRSSASFHPPEDAEFSRLIEALEPYEN